MTTDANALDTLTRLADRGVLVAVVGPTASGKTDLAARLAERVGGEVVSVDSVQVYRRFDVGSGKPGPEDLARAPHHLIDALEPDEPIDAARYAALASAAVEAIRSRGKCAVVCGGTFLWVKALLYGLADAPPASAEVRARHQAVAAKDGRSELHRALMEVDPTSAARLHPNDLVRVSRALEVLELTGETLSAIQARHAFRERRYDARIFARRVSASELSLRIGRRAEGWLEGGWVAEVARLLDAGYGGTRAMGSVGYREVCAYVRGEPNASSSAHDLREAIVRATRVFARRQRTWLNHAEVTWID